MQRIAWHRRVFEELEQRRMLAVLNVSLTGDGLSPFEDGKLTLREATQYVSGLWVPQPGEFGVDAIDETDDDLGTNDKIIIPSSLGSSITLSAGELEIKQSVEVEGPGSDLLTISAATNSRIFNIGNHQVPEVSITVSVTGLSLTDGNPDGSSGSTGGAILVMADNEDIIALSDLNIDGNIASKGGGIGAEVLDAAKLTISDSIFSGNTADGVGINIGSKGGGLYIEMHSIDYADVRPEVTIARSQFLSNISQNATSFPYYAGGGAGIFVQNGVPGTTSGNLTVSDSVIADNTSDGVAGGVHVRVEGYRSPELSAENQGHAVIERSRISGNTAYSAGGGVLLWGGTEYFDGTKETFQIVDSTISHNTSYGANTSENSLDPGEGGGGGVWINPGTTTSVVSNSTISNNRALSGGGVCVGGNHQNSRVIFRHSTIAENTAGPFIGESNFPSELEEIAHRVDEPFITAGGGVLINLGPGGEQHNPFVLPLFDHTIVADNIHIVQEDGLEGLNNNEAENYTPELALRPPAPPDGTPEVPGFTIAAYDSIIEDPGGHNNKFYKFSTDSVYYTVDPLLGPLQDNGGFKLPDGSTIETHELLYDPDNGIISPAIDRGDPNIIMGDMEIVAEYGSYTVPIMDQRGPLYWRVFDVVGLNDTNPRPIIDIGAFEYQPTPNPLGDYNQDGTVNIGDYPVWRNTLGAMVDRYTGADGSGNGIVDVPDYYVWKDHFGATTTDPTTEPAPQLVVFDEAPRIVDLVFSGSSSQHDPYSFADAMQNPGWNAGDQLRNVPVGALDTIAITFSEDVQVTADHLSLMGLRTRNEPYLADPSDFQYDPITHVATWKLTGWTLGDQYVIQLSDSVQDLEGDALDGEWTNPTSLVSTSTVSSFSSGGSGNGTAGSSFQFVATLVPGDANLDGVVGSADMGIVITNWGASISQFSAGDLDGDGTIGSADLAKVTTQWGDDFTLLRIVGDLNADYDIDTLDRDALIANYGMTAPTFTDGDLDGDGDIDLDDLNEFDDIDAAFEAFGLALLVG